LKNGCRQPLKTAESFNLEPDMESLRTGGREMVLKRKHGRHETFSWPKGGKRVGGMLI